MQPLVFAGISEPGRWETEDTLLAQAITTWERDRVCPSCGFPKRLAHDDDNDGWFEIHTDHCVACETRDRHNADQQGKNKPAGEVDTLIFDKSSG